MALDTAISISMISMNWAHRGNTDCVEIGYTQRGFGIMIGPVEAPRTDEVIE